MKNMKKSKIITSILIIVFILLVLIAFSFGIVLLINECDPNRDSDKYSIHYYIAVVFSSLAFGISTFIFSLNSRSINTRQRYLAEYNKRTEAYHIYSEITMTEEYQLCSFIFNQLDNDYHISIKFDKLELIKENFLNLIDDDFNDSDFLTKYIYEAQNLGIFSREFNSSENKERIYAYYLSSVVKTLLLNFSILTQDYTGGFLTFHEFDDCMAKDAIRFCLLACLLDTAYDFECENERVSKELDYYLSERKFENGTI